MLFCVKTDNKKKLKVEANGKLGKKLFLKYELISFISMPITLLIVYWSTNFHVLLRRPVGSDTSEVSDTLAKPTLRFSWSNLNSKVSL